MEEAIKRIRPIETAYKGCRFRSRLEARWGVFFDELGLEWEYEREGYDIEGRYYLPDFYLPQFNYLIEIKGVEPSTTECDLLRWVAEYAQADAAFVFWGPIKVPEGNGFMDEVAWAYKVHPYWDNYYMWCDCEKCGRLGIQFEGRSARLGCECWPDSDREQNADSIRLRWAFLRAKQARFEHGESG